jgi:type VI secretion system secreted protein VgrG
MVRLFVVPAFKLLSQQVDSRIFQDKTVPEILREVLEPALQVYDRVLDDTSIRLTYPKRDYCVQYGESDFDFACRLMEEEGIAYSFEFDADEGRETLTLTDQEPDKPNAGFPEIQTLMDASMQIIPDSRAETLDSESLQFLDWCQPEHFNKVLVRSFNWKSPDPANPLEAELIREEPRGRERELYMFSDRRKIVDREAGADPDATGTDIDECTPAAERSLQLFALDAARAQGRSNATAFIAGYRFQLGEHRRLDLDGQSFLLTRVIHSANCPDVERLAAPSSESRYENSFECIPEAQHFRPAVQTPRPRIFGPQTATVTGPPGEEIHTDKHGRIKVRMHWDRISPVDDTSSCWCRVAQSWAGPGWGALFIPRVGMEVVVEFLDGNPDRPLVTGCVYNGIQTPPYLLPDEKTKSTLKSQSSPQADGFNEFRFEDAAGEEEIFLHAQKDLNEKVLNNHNTRVGANQVNAVGGNQTETVGGDQGMTVTGKRDKTIGQDETNKIDGQRKTDVAVDDTLTVQGLSKRTLVAGLEETVTKYSKLTIADLYEVKVTGAQKVTVDGTSSLTVTDKHLAVATNTYSIAQDASASVVLEGKSGHLWGELEAGVGAGEGAAVVKCESTGKLGISAQSEITITVGKASITLKSDGSVNISGDTKVELSGGGASTVTLAAAAAEIGGPAIKSVAAGVHEIVGAMVKIN